MTRDKPKRHPRKRNYLHTAFFYTFLLIGFLVVSSLSYLHFVGFPDWLLKSFARSMRSSAYWVDSSLVKLGMNGDLIMEDVRVYRKYVIGPAVADAEKIIFALDPLGMIRKERLIRRVKVIDAALRPRMFFMGPEQKARKTDVDMDFRFGLELSKCTMWGINVEEMDGEIVCDGKTMSLIWNEGSIKSGDIEGLVKGSADYVFDDKSLKIKIDADMDPHVLIPLLEEVEMGFLIDLIERFEFEKTLPRFSVVVDKKIEKGSVLDVTGDVWLKDLKYRGVDLQKADGAVKVLLSPEVASVVVEPLLLLRSGEGLAEVSLNVDMNKHSVVFRGYSRMDPLPLALMTGAFSADFLDDFNFGDDVFISAAGVINYKDSNIRNVKCDVRANKLDYKKLPFANCKVKVEVDSYTNIIKEIDGELFEGKVLANGVFVFPPEDSEADGSFFVEWNLRDADFDTFMSSDLCGNKKKEFKGRLDSKGTVQGVPSWEKKNTLKGEGEMKVRDGRVFMLPIFGGLSKYMTKIIPGLDFVLRQSDADFFFKLSDGDVDFRKISIEGNVISLAAKGTCSLDKELDFNVKVTLMKEHTFVGKLLQVLSYPVSKLFEFRLTGKVDDPDWYLENFSKDLLQKLGLRGGRKEQEDAGEGEEEE